LISGISGALFLAQRTFVGTGSYANPVLANITIGTVFYRTPFQTFIGIVVSANTIARIAGTFFGTADTFVGAGRNAAAILAGVTIVAISGRTPNITTAGTFHASLVAAGSRTLLGSGSTFIGA